MKKSIGKKKVETVSDDIEMPIAQTGAEDDVEEDYQVIDMSSIPAPVIEFELPKLKSSKSEEKKTEKVEKKSGKTSEKKEKSKGTEVLTADKLNNEIVKLRAIIVNAKNRLVAKMVRKKKDLDKKSEKVEDKQKKEQFVRQATRLGEEIVYSKSIDRDTIAKFAILNQKTMNELAITQDTPVAERLMYKVSCHELVINAVKSFRAKYMEWNTTAAFLMQRLGLQYAHKKTEKADKKVIEKDDEKEEQEQKEEEEAVEKDEAESDKESGEEDDNEDDDDEKDFDHSDIEMADSDEEEEKDASKKRRELLLGLIGVKEDKSRPQLKPKKRKIEDDTEDIQSALKKQKAGRKATDVKPVEVTKPSTRQQVKEEMKKVLGNQMAQTEIKKPESLKKKTEPKKKNVTVKKEDKKEETKVEDEVPDNFEETTVVKKINLKLGGTIEKKANEKQQTKKVEKAPTPEVEEMDEDEAAFFLPKSTGNETVVKRVTKKAPVRDVIPVAPKVEEVKKNKGASKKKAAESSGEMHPSWMASQKKKEMLAAKPCGKKITFGDD